MQTEYNHAFDIDYLDLLDYILHYGVEKSDRTGTGTISTFGEILRFDLSKGQIPLLTTKKIHIKSVIHELLWFLSGSSSEYELSKSGTTIWAEWKTKNSELGKIYGEMWREFPTRELTYITPRIVEKSNIEPEIKILSISDKVDDIVGRKFTSNTCGEYLVVERNYHNKLDNQKNRYKIQFLQTGYITSIAYRTIQNGKVIDKLLPRVRGVGYLGDYDKHDPHVKMLRNTWYKLLDRCYNPEHKDYIYYGGSGVFVHNEWHCFAKFQEDVKYIKGWNNKRRNYEYQLDKDYYMSNCYSKNTCVWLSPVDNALYRNNPKAFEYILPSGIKGRDISVSHIAEKLGIKHTSLIYRALKNNKPYKGIYFNYLPDNGQIPRINYYVDQIEILINNIKNNPDSRRHYVTAWNPALLPNETIKPDINAEYELQSLPPCHHGFQCYVANGKLSLMFHMRSIDTFLGLPFNIASYGMLLCMIAEVCGLERGMLTWTGGDTHIYLNHVDQVREQLDRMPQESPFLKFARPITDIFDFKYEDFIIEGYNPDPAIKAPIAV